MRSVDKALILMLGRIFSSSTVMLLSILLARSLSKADYGTYVQTSMIVQLCSLLLSFGIPSSLTFFLPKPINRGRLILRSYGIMVLIGIAGALLLFCLKSYIASFFNNGRLSEFIVYAGLGVIFYMSSLLTRPILMYKKSTLLLAKIEILRSFLFLSSMTICVAVSPNIKYIIIIFVACFFFDFIASLVVVAGEVMKDAGCDSEDSMPISDQIRYSLPLGMSVLCWYSGRELDKYVISHYMSPDELAVYSRGAIELPLVHILASTISQLKLPDWVSQWDKGWNDILLAEWHKTIIKAALVLFPAFILLEILGKNFISLLYTDKYIQSVGIFYVYLFLLPLQITSYTAIVEATGKNRFVLIGYVVQLLISLAVSGYSIKYLGWFGPALVSVVGIYLWATYVLIVISKIFQVTFSNVFPWYRLAKIMVISILSGFIPALLMMSTDTFISSLIVQKDILHAVIIVTQSAVYGSCYVFLAKKFSIVDQEDIDTICRWLFVDKIRKIFGLTSRF